MKLPLVLRILVVLLNAASLVFLCRLVADRVEPINIPAAPEHNVFLPLSEPPADSDFRRQLLDLRSPLAIKLEREERKRIEQARQRLLPHLVKAYNSDPMLRSAVDRKVAELELPPATGHRDMRTWLALHHEWYESNDRQEFGFLSRPRIDWEAVYPEQFTHRIGWQTVADWSPAWFLAFCFGAFYAVHCAGRRSGLLIDTWLWRLIAQRSVRTVSETGDI
jgi:hypothetical protein